MPHDREPAATTRLLPPQGERAVTLLIIAQDVPRVFPLTEGVDVLIGRASTATIVIDDASLSRHHAMFRLRDGTVVCEDLGSANGTIVATDRIAPRTPTELPVGTTVHLGTVLVIVQQRTGSLAERLRPQALAAPSDELVQRLAASSISVLILGETGVGKEVMAERLHAASARRAQPFVKLNCAALMTSVLESELFGHERGAFTGAHKDKPGLVESADGGTLFLDEIGEADAAVQVKLLRVLEARETQRVGALRPRIVDVRFLAATNQLPAEQIAAGTLRADLYYRLAGFTITVPPLRDRYDQLPTIANELLRRHATPEHSFELGADAIERLIRHRWPGNVRELRNVLDRAVMLARGPRLHAHDIDAAIDDAPPSVSNATARPASATAAAPPAVDADPERARVLAAIDECGGNQTMAAAQLGMSRRSLVYRLQAWGLTRLRRR